METKIVPCICSIVYDLTKSQNDNLSKSGSLKQSIEQSPVFWSVDLSSQSLCVADLKECRWTPGKSKSKFLSSSDNGIIIYEHLNIGSYYDRTI